MRGGGGGGVDRASSCFFYLDSAELTLLLKVIFFILFSPPLPVLTYLSTISLRAVLFSLACKGEPAKVEHHSHPFCLSCNSLLPSYASNPPVADKASLPFAVSLSVWPSS